MPYINIKLTHEDGGLSKQQKEELVKKLTDSVFEVTGRGAKTCVITIDEISTDNYAIGGKTVTNIRKEQK